MPEERQNFANEELKKIVEENLRLTKEIHEMSKRVNRYVTIQHILSFVYLFLIVAPIILGAIFLPPLLSSLVAPYMDLLDGGVGAAEDMKSLDVNNLNNILDQVEKLNSGQR